MERIPKSAVHRITLLRGRNSASKAVQHLGGHEVTLDDRGRVPQRLQFSKKKGEKTTRLPDVPMWREKFRRGEIIPCYINLRGSRDQ